MFLALALVPAHAASLRLPAVFSDHMVLQRESKVAVWGWGEPGRAVTVSPGWTTGVYRGRVRPDGTWRVSVPTGKAGGPFRLTVWSGQTVSLDDILLGDVWVCSGQSNMEWPLRDTDHAAEDMASADAPKVRLFQVENKMSDKEEEDCQGKWQVSSPDTVAGFSAVGYLFGRELSRRLEVPIGLIDSTWGGTEAELWTSERGLGGLPDFARQMKSATADKPAPRHSLLYNAMIHPLIQFPIKGAIWYQGEANVARASQYSALFSAMIGDWRRSWRSDFPFYFVQIAPFSGYGEAPAAELREAQAKALSVPNTGMVVTTDIAGNVADIHPRDKRSVAHRLALLALAKTYGVEHGEWSGPMFRKAEFQGGNVRVFFEHARGLRFEGDEGKEFEVAGKDGKFHPAHARVEGETVLVWSDEVQKPTAVRMGWSSAPLPNLFNGAGLPASPFRSGS